jgi:hypothetical protein
MAKLHLIIGIAIVFLLKLIFFSNFAPVCLFHPADGWEQLEKVAPDKLEELASCNQRARRLPSHGSESLQLRPEGLSIVFEEFEPPHLRGNVDSDLHPWKLSLISPICCKKRKN